MSAAPPLGIVCPYFFHRYYCRWRGRGQRWGAGNRGPNSWPDQSRPVAMGYVLPSCFKWASRLVCGYLPGISGSPPSTHSNNKRFKNYYPTPQKAALVQPGAPRGDLAWAPHPSALRGAEGWFRTPAGPSSHLDATT